MTPSAWRTFLAQYSRELLKAKDLPVRPPSDARRKRWMGYAPASDRAIAAAEARLGTTLPPSLKSFYRVSNGWRALGFSIYGIRPVSKIDWLRVADPDLYQVACDSETATAGEPAHMREYHFEQGTRVKRSLLISTAGDAAVLLLDPETRDQTGEWAAGMWASWLPGMTWSASSFAGLLRHEKQSFIRLRDDKPIDYGLTPTQAKKKLHATDEKERLLAVMALQGTRDPAQADELLRTYRDRHAGGVVREMAIRAAGELKSREAYDLAIHDLPASVAAGEAGRSVDDGGEEVRPYALVGAILSYGEDAGPVFAQWIDAPSPQLRRLAIANLGHCRRSDFAREKLLQLLRDPEVERRETAAYALTQLMDKKTVPALIDALNDTASSVRCHALQGLLHLHLAAGDAVGAIERLARTEKNPDVLKKIESVLPALKASGAKRGKR